MVKIQKKNRDDRLGWILTMVGIIVLGLIILMKISPEKSSPADQVAKTEQQNYSALTFLVSTQFNCSCSDCNDVVSDCTCPTGKATKDYIEQKVRQGYQKQEIIDLVKDAYGHYRG